MWFQLINTVLGVWLIASAGLLGYAGPSATNDYILGPLIAACAFVSVWEVLRPMRWVNVIFGIWLLAAPWILNELQRATWNHVIVGLLLIGLGTMRGPTTQHFGGGWSMLWGRERVRQQIAAENEPSSKEKPVREPARRDRAPRREPPESKRPRKEPPRREPARKEPDPHDRAGETH